MTLEPTIWQGCYGGGGWQRLLVPDAFQHPAKFSYALINRIYKHGLERGYWQRGSHVIDPFGGVALGGIVAAYHGLRWTGCELEERFVQLGQANIDLHRRALAQFGDPIPVLLQGDSRRLAAVLQEAGSLVSSPPYSSSLNTGTDEPMGSGGRLGGAIPARRYGDTTGQLGRMRDENPPAVVSSPPYADSPISSASNIQSAKCPESPPARDVRAEGYAGVVSSPPYEKQQSGGGLSQVRNGGDYNCTIAPPSKHCGYQHQGDAEGQLGNSTGDTFWQAAREIVQQCHLILPPGATACWVVKAFVRDKAIVDFPGQWLTLCQECGFELVEWCRASLVKRTEEPGLFGEPVTTTTDRKSFFRRLYEKKPGAPRIDFEEVLFLRRLDDPQPSR